LRRAESSRQALALLKSREPDLLLADITMPGKSGLELIKDVRVLLPAVSILVLSMHDETIYAERVIRAGARGYIMKSEGGAKMLDAIRTVLRGRVYVSENLSDQLLDRFSGRRAPAPNSALGTLTDREFEVFQNLGQGLTSHEIGRELQVSPKTVDTHRLHIKQKLGLRTMPELIKYAVRWGATQELI